MSETVNKVAVLSSAVKHALLADVQYFDFHASSAFNRKMKGIITPGFYGGFEPALAGGLNLKITSLQGPGGHGVASVDVNNHQITVQQIEDVTLAIPVNGVTRVMLEANYQYGVKTSQVDDSSDIHAARIFTANISVPLADNHLEICRVTVPADATELTLDMIDSSHRRNKALGITLSSEIDSDAEHIGASSLAVKKAVKAARDETEKQIEELVDGAPASLDTLNKIAHAINNDPDFFNTLTAILKLKAPLDSPELTGIPTTPTPPLSVSNKQVANTEYVQAAVAALVGSSPESLDTLAELAKALGEDPNFATTMLDKLAGKQPLDSTLTNLSGKDVAGLIQYLGLVETINRAAAALQKDQNGADIPNKDGFVRNIGAGRAFSGSVSIGGGGNWTTADFIVWLESQGAFNHPYWMCKGSWAYADNRIITDTGCGNIQLAGAVVEVMGVRGAMTIRVTTASSGAGTLNAQFTYCNHGEGYPAPWRRDLNRSGDDITGDLSLQNLHTRGVIKSDGEIQTTSANAYRIVYGDYGVFWHQNGNDLYLMLTNRGDPYGAFNDLRPFVVNLVTGKVSITNGATIHGLRVESSIAIGTDNALGANAIVLGDSDTGFKQNGDGILDVYANNAHVFRFTTGVNNSIQALRSESYISAKGGVYEFNGSQDVRVYSPHNPPPAVDLSPYATMGWVLQNFVQNIRVSAAVGRDFRDGWGYSANDAAFATAISMVGGSSNVGSLLVRYVQKLINNTWYNITE